MMTRSWEQLLPWMAAFAIAMGFLEAAVVVYLRALYYTDGFSFPLASIDLRIAFTELVREACTLVMLLAPGALVARSLGVRFAWFCFCFGVWDLTYYLFLKAILGWPASVFSWDVLFLLPVVWVGPVLAPCLISVGMILVAVLWLRRSDEAPRPSRWVWATACLGGLVMFWSFIEGPVEFLRSGAVGTASILGGGGQNATLQQLRDYIPERFDWPVFLIGLALATALPVALLRRRK